MKQTRIHVEWSKPPLRQFRTGVSLHGHTLYSHETLAFMYRWRGPAVVLRRLLEGRGAALDLRRAWWTPPCAPYHAWRLEKNQIEQRLQLNALVSLTDHDSIEAPLALRALTSCRNVPVSFEWTVPYGPTFFHLGVHNLPAGRARRVFAELERVTTGCRHSDLMAILRSLTERRETLVVFNHPCWDEQEIGAERHSALSADFIRTYGESIHALEVNGLRPWAENCAALQMASAFGKPVISGGDRHSLQPNAMVDLTNASTFEEYVDQVRSGSSDVLVLNPYRAPFRMRILENLQDVLQEHEEHARGWRLWSDRVFYRCDDGLVRSLTELYDQQAPSAIRVVVNGIALIGGTYRFMLRKTAFAC